MRIVGIAIAALGLLAACTPLEGYQSEVQPLRMIGPPGSKLEPVSTQQRLDKADAPMLAEPGVAIVDITAPASGSAVMGEAEKPQPEIGALIASLFSPKDAAPGPDGAAGEVGAAPQPNAPSELKTVEKAADAPAGPSEVAVQAGEETVIAKLFRVNEDCSFAAPSVVVVEGPRHGALRATQGPHTLSAEDDVDPACVGRTALAFLIHYTPESGFTGADRLVYRRDSVGAHSETSTIEMTVR